MFFLISANKLDKPCLILGKFRQNTCKIKSTYCKNRQSIRHPLLTGLGIVLHHEKSFSYRVIKVIWN